MTIAACEIMLSCCASEPVHDCRCAADNNVLPTSARTYVHVPYVAALNLSAWLWLHTCRQQRAAHQRGHRRADRHLRVRGGCAHFLFGRAVLWYVASMKL